jgi:hypothetical protein
MSGRAVDTKFHLSAPDWQDDDLPLVFRYSYGTGNATVIYLNDFSADVDFQNVVLPAGDRIQKYELVISVDVADAFGAQAAAVATVQVQPYAPPEGTALSDAATELINAATDSASGGDLASVGPLVLCLAATLNTIDEDPDADTDVGAAAAKLEATKTRTILMDAITGSAAEDDLTAETVGRTSQIMSAITAKPEELSPLSTDKAIGFASTMVTKLENMGTDVVSDVAVVMSNLLLASTQQFRATNASQTAEDGGDEMEKAQQRSSQMASIVNSLASTLAAQMVVGEEEMAVETESFGMRVKTDLPAELEGKLIGDGRVRVPRGATGAEDGPVNAKVLAWKDAGPLYWAASKSPGNDSTTKLRSPLLSVIFTTSQQTSPFLPPESCATNRRFSEAGCRLTRQLSSLQSCLEQCDSGNAVGCTVTFHDGALDLCRECRDNCDEVEAELQAELPTPTPTPSGQGRRLQETSRQTECHSQCRLTFPELQIKDLDDPFVITLALPPSTNGEEMDEKAVCAYWNEELQEWITDGILISRTVCLLLYRFFVLCAPTTLPPPFARHILRM